MAFITKKHLSRRTFLKGAGVTHGVAFAGIDDSGGNALAQTAAHARTRFGAIYVPHGATMYKWTPEKDGTELRVLRNPSAARAIPEVCQCHQRYESSGRLRQRIRDGQPQPLGSGVPQRRPCARRAASRSGRHAWTRSSRRKSARIRRCRRIEMTIEGSTLSCDGLSCAYRNTISWQNETTPLPMQNSPQVVFERLFGDGSTDAERKSRRSLSVSLLDSVVGEVDGVKKNLPAADRSRLDQYLNDVREIERRIQKAGEQLSDDIKLPAAPIGIPADFEDHIKLMFDLQVLAWQADVTRVATMLMAKELSGAVYSKSGVRDAFHTLSHHSNQKENMDRFAVLNRYHVTILTYLLEKLKNTPDGDGNLLDHSIVLYGSAMGDGNQHNHDPLPVVLVGGASGKLKGGRHIRNAPKTTMSNLLLAVLDKLDIHQEKFGDSTGMMSI